MAIIKRKQMTELGKKELSEKLSELRLELSRERASSEIGGSVKNPSRIREIRRTIARILTKINENERREVKRQRA